MYRPISSIEIESVVKNVPKNKLPGLDGISGKFYQIYKEELVPVFPQTIAKKSKMTDQSKIHSTSPLPWYPNQKKTLWKITG